MKRIAIIPAALVLQFAIAPRARSADVEVSFDYFYDSLKPAGEWIYSDDYGYCWSPEGAREESWRPYADGSWAWTDTGWTWVSNENFRWVTYHYGRWARLKKRWCWVPGYEWAPAWVSWRQTDREIGWAPLPPEAQWVQDTGFQTWTDSHYDIGPTWYNFVTVEHFGAPEVRSHLVATTENVRIIEKSVNVTNITYKQNVVNHIYVGGPDITRIERAGGPKIRRLELRVAEDFRGERGDREGRERRNFTRVEGNTLLVAAPRIRREENIRPPEGVRVRYEKQAIDRGWGGRDGREGGEFAARLREKYREEGGKEDRGKLPPKAERSPLAIAPPASLPPARPGDADRPDAGDARTTDPKAPPSEGTPDVARKPGDNAPPAGRDTSATDPKGANPPPGRDPAVRPGVKPGTVDPADSNAARTENDVTRPKDPNPPKPPQPGDPAPRPKQDSGKPDTVRPGAPNPPAPGEDRNAPAPNANRDKPPVDPKNPDVKPGTPGEPARDRTAPRQSDKSDARPGRRGDEDPNEVKPVRPNDKEKTTPRDPDKKAPSSDETKGSPRRETPDNPNEVKPSREPRPKADEPRDGKRPPRTEEEASEGGKPVPKKGESEDKEGPPRRGQSSDVKKPDAPAKKTPAENGERKPVTENEKSTPEKKAPPSDAEKAEKGKQANDDGKAQTPPKAEEKKKEKE